MPRNSEDGTLSNETPFNMRIGFALVILAAVAGFHPWAMAQIRSVVQEENRVVVLQQDAKSDRQFSELTRKLAELTVEVRGLRVIILSRSVK